MRTSFRMLALPAGVLLLLGTAPAQVDTGTAASAQASRQVLIADDNSALENEVVRIVTDSLAVYGYSVRSVDIESLDSEPRSTFAAVVLLSAVKAAKLRISAQTFVDGVQMDDRDNILIANVYGERWDLGSRRASAVTSATKAYRPVPVAQKIPQNLRTILHMAK